MTERQSFIIRNDHIRANALRAVREAGENCRVTVAPPQRSLPQNAKLWAMLSDVARAKPEGRSWTPETWKAAFMHFLGHQVRFCDGLDGTGPFPLGFHSSRLTVREMADLITCIQEYGDRHRVEWRDTRRGGQREELERAESAGVQVLGDAGQVDVEPHEHADRCHEDGPDHLVGHGVEDGAEHLGQDDQPEGVDRAEAQRAGGAGLVAAPNEQELLDALGALATPSAAGVAEDAPSAPAPRPEVATYSMSIRQAWPEDKILVVPTDARSPNRDATGPWVHHDDHLSTVADLVAEIERLTKERDAALHDPWCPDACPITGRKFFMWIDGEPTYGGPFDSYTIPERDADGEYSCRRYDHDEGGWKDWSEGLPIKVVDESDWLSHQDRAEATERELAAAREREERLREALEQVRAANAPVPYRCWPRHPPSSGRGGMSGLLWTERCISCGRWLRVEPGVSWSQCWSYDMDGTPDLHDPRFQCAACTEKHGPLSTNCAHPERYSGVYRTEDFAGGGE